MIEFLAAEGKTTYELPWTPVQYGVVAFIVLTLMVVIITRMNRDR
jgi:hypothetical protein